MMNTEQQYTVGGGLSVPVDQLGKVTIVGYQQPAAPSRRFEQACVRCAIVGIPGPEHVMARRPQLIDSRDRYVHVGQNPHGLLASRVR